MTWKCRLVALNQFFSFTSIKQLAIRRRAAQASKKERSERLSATFNELHSQTCRIAR